MSNIFSEIDEEVKVDKYKKIWTDYRKYIIFFVSVIVIIFIILVSYSLYSEKRQSRISGQYLEALSLIKSDKKKAEEIFQSIVDEGVSGYSHLANLSLGGMKLQEGAVKESKIFFTKNKKHLSFKDPLFKITDYIYSIQSIDANDEQVKTRVNDVFNFGGYWSMLATELKGYIFIKEKDYDSALKAFEKVTNEELSTQSSKSRANEMIRAINLIKDK